jgi:predicted XRE-type DNA-binding protein
MAKKSKKSSGNVFKDLGFENSDEMLTKAKLVYQINQCIDKRKLSQAKVSNILEIPQSKVSLLMNGKIFGFSVEKLMHFLNCLSFDVEIRLKPIRTSSMGQIRVYG